MSEETKKCTKCGEVKPMDAFVKNKRLPSGFEGVCRKCREIMNKVSRAINKESVKNSRDKWEINNHEKRRKYLTEWQKKKDATKRKELSDDYVVSAFVLKTWVRRKDVTIELIELKRQQIQFYRLAKEFKRTVKEVFK